MSHSKRYIDLKHKGKFLYQNTGRASPDLHHPEEESTCQIASGSGKSSPENGQEILVVWRRPRPSFTVSPLSPVVRVGTVVLQKVSPIFTQINNKKSNNKTCNKVNGILLTVMCQNNRVIQDCFFRIVESFLSTLYNYIQLKF